MKNSNKIKRTLSLIIAACLMISLAACSGGNGSEVSDISQDTQSQSQTNSPALNLTTGKTSYAVNELVMPFETSHLVNILSEGEMIFFLYATEENEEYTYHVSSMNVNGDSFIEIQESSYISGIALGSGGLWTLSSEDGETYKINSFAFDGTPVNSFDLPEGVDTQLYAGAISVDSEGYVYYTAYSDTDTTVYVMEQDGTLSFELKTNGVPISVVTTAEGRVGVVPYDVSAVNAGNISFELCLIDAKSQSWGKSISLGYATNLYTGLLTSFYVNDSSTLYAYDVDTGSGEVLFNWLDINLAHSVYYLSELEGGSFVVAGADIDYSTYSYDSFQLYIVSPSDGSADSEKTVLTLAGLIYNSTLASSIADFNRSSSEYVIEYKTYLSMADLTGVDALSDAATQFNNDVLSGNMADIIDMYYLSADLYAAKGLLDDLYAYIDADQTIQRSDFFENILDAISINGKLSYITNGVIVYSMFGSSDTFGSEPGITAAELNRILNDNPEMEYPLGPMINKGNFLLYMLYGNVDFIDWETGKCSFDSEDFIQILEIANRMPLDIAEIDYNNITDYLDSSNKIQSGEQVAGITEVNFVEQIAAYNQRLGSRLNITGLPTESGACHVAFAASQLGISARSQNKEAAWEFVRMLLNEEVQESNVYIPISRSAFNKLMNKSVEGSSIGKMYYTDLEVTEADVEVLRNLMESVNYSASIDQVVVSIVNEEAEAYFNGAVTAQQAASYIQSRIEMYVSEQM